MVDLVKRLRDKWKHSEEDCYEAADEIERLRAALLKIEYLDSPQVRGLPRRISIYEIARTALGNNND